MPPVPPIESSVYPNLMPCHCSMTRYGATLIVSAAGNDLCCTKDDTFAGTWCQDLSSQGHRSFGGICCATEIVFCHGNFDLNTSASEVTPSSPNRWHSLQEAAAFCDVLCIIERVWLAHNLKTSGATIYFVVAPSVLLSNPTAPNAGCSGSEWDGYRPAQINLLHTLANASTCTIVLAGAAGVIHLHLSQECECPSVCHF
jgi:alkaline phosphatase D